MLLMISIIFGVVVSLSIGSAIVIAYVFLKEPTELDSGEIFIMVVAWPIVLASIANAKFQRWRRLRKQK